MKIDIETIKELTDSVTKYELEELIVKSGSTKIAIKREFDDNSIHHSTGSFESPPKIISKNSEKKRIHDKNRVESEINYQTLRSPMVGTYYSAPSPDSDPFVTDGQIINIGDTLCIIEAMKLMNEVKAEKKYKIIKSILTDGEPVTKETDLFFIEEI